MPLIGTLTSGVSAVRTFSKGLEVIGANIANVNTTAYKSSSTSFADTFSNTLRAASANDSAVQIGTGVQVGGITTNFTQGALVPTGNNNDLGISGSGYFVVQDVNGNNFATRDGSFHFDTNGYLVNTLGYNVLDTAGAKIQVSGLQKTYTAATPPVHNGYAAVPYSKLASVSVGSDGTITAYATDGTATTYGVTYNTAAATIPPTVASGTPVSVGLLGVSDQSKLMRQGNNLYDFSSTGASLASNMSKPGASGAGKLQTGVLEQSNVDLTDQFSALITTQRSFQAGSRLITVSDSVLEDIVNLKRS
jgi:flagellar hook protein FlgE